MDASSDQLRSDHTNNDEKRGRVDEPHLLTITEAAERLRTPVSTLRWWRHPSVGPRSFRVGRVVYRPAEFDEWVRLPGDGASTAQATERLTHRHVTPRGTVTLTYRYK